MVDRLAEARDGANAFHRFLYEVSYVSDGTIKPSLYPNHDILTEAFSSALRKAPVGETAASQIRYVFRNAWVYYLNDPRKGPGLVENNLGICLKDDQLGIFDPEHSQQAVDAFQKTWSPMLKEANLLHETVTSIPT